MRGGFLCGSIILEKPSRAQFNVCLPYGWIILLCFQIVNKEYCIEHTHPLRLKCLWKTPQGHHFKL